MELVLFSMIRYFIGASFFYFFMVFVLVRLFPNSRINNDVNFRHTSKQITKEIGWSLVTAIIYGIGGYIFLSFLVPMGWTRLSPEVSTWGLPYFFISIILCLLLHDFFFFISHRLLHTPFLFKHVHKVHHHFKNPSSFAIWAFHPVEGFLQLVIALLPLFIVPMHLTSAFIYIFIIQFYNLIGHSGYEFLPYRMATLPITKFHNTPTHHNMHHRYINCHYTLYFNYWDRLFKSLHPNYEREFKNTSPARMVEPIKSQGKAIPRRMMSTRHPIVSK